MKKPYLTQYQRYVLQQHRDGKLSSEWKDIERTLQFGNSVKELCIALQDLSKTLLTFFK